MRQYLVPALALALAMLPLASAQAADTATLGCVADTMGEAGRGLLEGDHDNNLSRPEQKHSYSDATQAALRAALQQCATRHGWSDKAAEASLMYTMSHATWPVAEQKARAAKIDLAAVKRHFNALTESERRSGTEMDTLQIMATRLSNAGLLTESNAALGGAICAFMIVEYRSRATFAES